jgi:hypothetical protein
MPRFCGVEGCRYTSTTNAAYCARHNGRNARNGHPTMLALKLDEVVPYMRRTRNLLRPLRSTHEGTKLAADELDTLLRDSVTRAAEGGAMALYRHQLARLSSAGVDGLDILEASSAVVLLDADQPSRIKGGRALRFAVGRFVCSLASMGGVPVGAKVIEPLGEYLLVNYAPLFAVVVRHFSDASERAKERSRILSSSFTQTDGS